MADVPAPVINGESVNLWHWRNVVYTATRALILERYRDADHRTRATAGRTLDIQTSDLWRDVSWAISDILRRPVEFCGAVLMKVKALDDTVDSLCFRYWHDAGVTEKVLDANPGLCQQVFLDAGQDVEMPSRRRKKREMIQLWGSSSEHHSNRITEQVIAWLFDHPPTVVCSRRGGQHFRADESLYDGRTLVPNRNGIAGVRRCHGH